MQQGLSEFEETLAEQSETKRQTRKARNHHRDRLIARQLTTFSHCAKGNFIPKIVFPATQGVASEAQTYFRSPLREKRRPEIRLRFAGYTRRYSRSINQNTTPYYFETEGNQGLVGVPAILNLNKTATFQQLRNG